MSQLIGFCDFEITVSDTTKNWVVTYPMLTYYYSVFPLQKYI